MPTLPRVRNDPQREELPLLSQRQPSDVDPRFQPRKRHLRRLFSGSGGSKRTPPPPARTEERTRASNSCTPIPSRFVRSGDDSPLASKKKSAPTLLIPSLPENPHDSSKKSRPLAVPTRKRVQTNHDGKDPPESASNQQKSSSSLLFSGTAVAKESYPAAQPSDPLLTGEGGALTAERLSSRRLGHEREGPSEDRRKDIKSERPSKFDRGSNQSVRSNTADRSLNSKDSSTLGSADDLGSKQSSQKERMTGNQRTQRLDGSESASLKHAISEDTDDGTASEPISSSQRSSLLFSTAHKFYPAPLVPSDAPSHTKLVKEVLSRPFGRQSLGKLARQYCVTVNPAELEEDGVWKYRVWVQQPPVKHSLVRQSLTTALIYRSLSDFLWLESNLRREYHGAALVPRLECYPINLSLPNPPPQALQDFLGDLLNGIRGQGEFYIPPDKILSSSAIEAFLYKSSLQAPVTPSANSPRDELLQFLFVRPLELCGVRDGFFYSSRADDMSCGGESSLVTSPTTSVSRPPPPLSSTHVIHCELLEAESALCGQYAATTSSLLDKLKQLTQQEAVASQNWRRLAMSLQMLFGYEKESEGFKLEPSVKSPWRKISRVELDKSVQSLASCYARESAYEILTRMLLAFQGDLECIPLAMAAYRSSMEDMKQDLLWHETLLRHSLTAFCRSTPIRTSRMAWRFWNTCASQCAALAHAASTLERHMEFNGDAVQKLKRRHQEEASADRTKEIDLVTRIINIASRREPSLVDNISEVEVDSDINTDDYVHAEKRAAVLDMAESRAGRWDSRFSLSILESLGVINPSLDDTLGRDLKRIRKYAIGLREHVNRCLECVRVLQSILSSILVHRKDALSEMAKLFSGRSMQANKRSQSPSVSVLARAGIDTSDPLGWSCALPNNNDCSKRNSFVNVGDQAVLYLKARDSHWERMLNDISQLLKEYYKRVEVIEGYVFMECVGLQMERHFSQQRSVALTAFEKKTDLTAALNIANRKRMAKLKAELHEKLEKLADVSHTVVKETKERHLESKTLKAELHEVATRWLSRARETSTERVVQILATWAKETENAAAIELKALGEAMATLERAIGQEASLFYPPKISGNEFL